MGDTGAAGPAGPKGDKGDKGDTGTVDTSNFYDKSTSDGRYLRSTVTVVATSGTMNPGASDNTTATCPAGYQATGRRRRHQ